MKNKKNKELTDREVLMEQIDSLKKDREKLGYRRDEILIKLNINQNIMDLVKLRSRLPR
ncbi:MAG: hypothetical protein RR942_06070 [Romboutsia sp.]